MIPGIGLTQLKESIDNSVELGVVVLLCCVVFLEGSGDVLGPTVIRKCFNRTAVLVVGVVVPLGEVSEVVSEKGLERSGEGNVWSACLAWFGVEKTRDKNALPLT